MKGAALPAFEVTVARESGTLCSDNMGGSQLMISHDG